jgi:hypothetical protein
MIISSSVASRSPAQNTPAAIAAALERMMAEYEEVCLWDGSCRTKVCAVWAPADLANNNNNNGRHWQLWDWRRERGGEGILDDDDDVANGPLFLKVPAELAPPTCSRRRRRRPASANANPGWLW